MLSSLEFGRVGSITILHVTLHVPNSRLPNSRFHKTPLTINLTVVWGFGMFWRGLGCFNGPVDRPAYRYPGNDTIRDMGLAIRYEPSWTKFGKELFILFAASAFRKLSSIYVFSYFVISLLVLRAGYGI